MGVIYKIFKQRRNLNMDLSTKVKLEALMRHQKNVETNLIIKSEDASAEAESRAEVKDIGYERTFGIESMEQQQHEPESGEQPVDEQQQMNADYITQLCRFLAENACKKRAQNASILARQQHQKLTVKNMNCALQASQKQLQPPLNYVAATPVLMDTANIGGHNRNMIEHINNLQQGHYVGVGRGGGGAGDGDGGGVSHQQQQRQGIKRDILLKIRKQIFERKRQRQMAHMQQQLIVWRPW